MRENMIILKAQIETGKGKGRNFFYDSESILKNTSFYKKKNYMHLSLMKHNIDMDNDSSEV